MKRVHRKLQKRSVPMTRAVLALTATLSIAPDVVGGHKQRDEAAAAINPEKYEDEATSTPGRRVLRSSERKLNHRRNRNRKRNRNRDNVAELQTTKDNRNVDAEVETNTDGDGDDGQGKGSVRLRLYWEQGYFWQEDKDEMWWCMECTECDHGDSIKIGWCGSTTRQQFTKVGSTIRPLRDQSLCMTVTGHSEENPVRLYDCDDNDSDQKFDGYKDSGRFELHPSREPDHCISQMHHPKNAERVYPQPCHETRSHETTYWIVY